MKSATTWQDPTHPWEQRGAEHAAEAITWALADYPISPHIRLTDRTCAGLADAYQTLTGTAPPHGHTEHCD